MDLKDRIEEVMRAVGWTKDSEVAAVAEVTRSAVGQWRGKTSTAIQTITMAPAGRLEAATGYAARWIATGEGPVMKEKSNSVVSMDNWPFRWVRQADYNALDGEERVVAQAAMQERINGLLAERRKRAKA